MRAQDPMSPSPAVVAFAIAALAAASAALPTPALASPDAEPVDCKLPPQVRTLGRNMTYLAAGRLVRLSAGECAQRGGSWNGRGPGRFAGGGPLAVTIGAGAGGPACPAQANVWLHGGGTLTVRAGPGTGFERIDRLLHGARVFVCDRAGDAGWVGVVYGDADCGLAAPVDPPRAYDGACHSGWVRSSYLR
jgi:hypothetical protein